MKRKVIVTSLAILIFLTLGIAWQFRGPNGAVCPACPTGSLEVSGDMPKSGATVQPMRTPSGSAGEESATALLSAMNVAESDPDRQSEELEHLVQQIPQSLLRATLADLIDRDKDFAAAIRLRQLVVRRWGEIEPRAAARWLIDHSGTPFYEELVPQFGIVWAEVDPQAATGWAVSLPESSAKAEVLQNIGYEIAGTEPTTAIGIAAMLAPGTQRDNLIEHAVSQWASADTASAMDWVSGITDDSLRQRLVAALAVGLADKDAAAAGALVANRLPPGVEQDRAVIEIVQRWAQTSPVSAGAWISAFPDSVLRQTAVQNLIAVWGLQDNPGAANWVRSLPPGALREAGFAALANANFASFQSAGPIETLDRQTLDR